MKQQYSSLGINWQDQIGGKLANGNQDVFWGIQVLIELGWENDYKLLVEELEKADVLINLVASVTGSSYGNGVIYWAQEKDWAVYMAMHPGADMPGWYSFPPLSLLSHEMKHAYDDKVDENYEYSTATCPNNWEIERRAMEMENSFRYAFYMKVPSYNWVVPRPAYGWSDMGWCEGSVSDMESALHPDITWEEYWNEINGYPRVPSY